MTDPYYSRIENPQDLLKHYLNIYKGDYSKSRARQIVTLFPELRNKQVLDIGSGGGFYSLAAHKKNPKFQILTDRSAVCVKAGKLNLRENASGLSFEGVISDASKLPFRSEYFDFVLCIDLIEHVQNDDALLNEIERVLKNKGILLLATQNSNSLNYLIEAPIQRRILKNRNWMGWDPTHLRFYTQKSLSHLLDKCGLDPTVVAGTYFIPYLMAMSLGKINRRLSRTLYQILKLTNDKLELRLKAPWNSFGWGILCLCAKRRI